MLEDGEMLPLALGDNDGDRDVSIVSVGVTVYVSRGVPAMVILNSYISPFSAVPSTAMTQNSSSVYLSDVKFRDGIGLVSSDINPA